MDRQFSYVSFKLIYKYTTEFGVILKRQYLGLIEEKDDNGTIVEKHVSLDWDDYFLDPNDFGVTSGDRVLSEFWVSYIFFTSNIKVYILVQ